MVGASTDAVEIAQAGPIGVVGSVSGTAFAVGVDGTERPLTPGSLLFEGDVIRTAPGASLGLTLNDRTAAALGGDSQVGLDRYSWDPDAAAGEARFSVIAGTATFDGGGIARSGAQALQVATPAARLGLADARLMVTADGTSVTAVNLSGPGDGGAANQVVLLSEDGQVLSAVDQGNEGWRWAAASPGADPERIAIGQADMQEMAAILDVLGGGDPSLGSEAAGTGRSEGVLGEEISAAFDAGGEADLRPANGPQGPVSGDTPVQGQGTSPSDSGTGSGDGFGGGVEDTVLSGRDVAGPFGRPVSGSRFVGGFGGTLATASTSTGFGNKVLIGGSGSHDVLGRVGRQEIVVGESVSAESPFESFSIGGTGGQTAYDYSGSNKHLTIKISGNIGVHLTTGSGNDTVTGGGGDDVIKTGDGDDIVYGGGGADTVIGGSGNGNDAYYGGTKDLDDDFGDWVRFPSASQTIVVTLGDDNTEGSARGANGQTSAEIGTDRLYGFENVQAGRGDDTVTGNNRANILLGNDGADTLDGGGGADTLLGENGHDVLVFDAADTTIDGGAGIDTLRLDDAVVDLTAVAGLAAKVSGIERIALAGSGGTTATVSTAVIAALTEGTTLTVDGDANDILISGEAWTTDGSTVVEGGNTYQLYTRTVGSDTYTLRIDTDVARGGTLGSVPTGVALSAAVVAENDAGAVVGTLSASDADVGDTVTFTLTDASGLFEVVGTTLRLKSGLAADYETASSYAVTVHASDGQHTVDRAFTIAVTDVLEYAPDLDVTSERRLADIAEDPTSSADLNGDSVSILIGGVFSDADATTMVGMAVTRVDNSHGVWEYSTDGGGSWQPFTGDTGGTIDLGQARLLDDSDRVRFMPAEDWGGTATFSFRAWDQSAGTAGGTMAVTATGGSTAFSENEGTARIVVQPDGPVVVSSGAALSFSKSVGAVDIDSGLTVTGSDDDTTLDGAVVAITTGFVPGDTLSVDTGTIDPATYGITASYDADVGVLKLSGTATLAQYQEVLRAVQFNHTSATPASGSREVVVTLGADTLYNPDNGHYYKVVANSTVDWAAAAAAQSELYGRHGYLATLTDAAETALAYGLLPDGTVGAWIGGQEVGSEGHWEWATGPDSGTPFWNSGPVSGQYSDWGAGAPSNNSGGVGDALLLWGPAAAESKRGTWDDLDPTAVGTTTHYLMEYGGTTGDTTPPLAFVRTFTVNDAPVLDTSGTPTLGTIAEDTPASGIPGTAVSAIVGTSITDLNAAAAEGIAVTGLSNTDDGTWQYSLDDGTTWQAFSATVSDTNATLLAGTARIRFLPEREFAGEVSISYQAWDQTTGWNGLGGVDVSGSNNGGSTAFSTESETATLSVTAVADAPHPNGNGGALSLAGTGAITAALDAGAITNQVTLETWVNFAAIGTKYNFFSVSNDAATDRYVMTLTADGQLQFFLDDNYGSGMRLTSTGLSLSAGQWYHVAMTYDGSDATIYLNGEDVAGGTDGNFSLSPYSALDVAIGADAVGTGLGFKTSGLIDEARIWSEARSQDEIRDYMTRPLDPHDPTVEPTLQGYWTLDGDATDSSVHGRNGTGSGTTDWVTEATADVSPLDGQFALTLDGDGDYVSLDAADSAALVASQDFTFEGWVKWDSDGTDNDHLQRVFDFTGDDGSYMYLTVCGVGASRIRFVISDTQGEEQVFVSNGGFTFPDDEWTHLALTLGTDGNGDTTGTLFLNGQAMIGGNEVGSGTWSGADPSTMSGIDTGYFGHTDDGGVADFDGQFDDFRIWNVARTEAEIQADMSRELDGDEAGLVGYWTFNDAVGSLAQDSAGGHDGTLVGDAAWFDQEHITLDSGGIYDGLILGRDPDGGAMTVTFTGVSEPPGPGSVAYNFNDHDGTYKFIPGDEGLNTLSYTVSDTDSNAANGTIEITYDLP